MYLIEIDTRKFDFQGISHEEYLEFFGYRVIKKISSCIYAVTKTGLTYQQLELFRIIIKIKTMNQNRQDVSRTILSLSFFDDVQFSRKVNEFLPLL